MVKIDKNKCIGCGVCASICSDGFEMIDNKSHVKNPNASCVKEAASSCPVNAIILDEAESSTNTDDTSGQDDNAQEKEDISSNERGMGRGMGRGRGRGRGMGGHGLQKGRHMGRGRF